jgi:hypothetical protein
MEEREREKGKGLGGLIFKCPIGLFNAIFSDIKATFCSVGSLKTAE